MPLRLFILFTGLACVGSLAAADEPSRSPLQNFQQPFANFYCGGEPADDDAFAELARLGIRTVVSVDGITPNHQAARRHGLRYVHIPIGYAGVESHAALSLTRLVREAEMPIYLHCHHGKHRGPTAAAIAGLAAEKLDRPQAIALLKESGTSKNYLGLWKAVETFELPPADTQLPNLVTVSPVRILAHQMATLDRSFDTLAQCQASGWKSPANHPDIVPQRLALLVREGLHELGRVQQKMMSSNFYKLSMESEHHAESLRLALVKENTDLATKQFVALKQSCVACHQKFRD